MELVYVALIGAVSGTLGALIGAFGKPLVDRYIFKRQYTATVQGQESGNTSTDIKNTREIYEFVQQTVAESFKQNRRLQEAENKVRMAEAKNESNDLLLKVKQEQIDGYDRKITELIKDVARCQERDKLREAEIVKRDERDVERDRRDVEMLNLMKSIAQRLER